MTRWHWIVIREQTRWILRGSDFTKLEILIDQMAAPLHAGTADHKTATRLHKRVRRAVKWLPAERAEKFHDMMARAGHPLKER
jgi:hypothetical protein